MGKVARTVVLGAVAAVLGACSLALDGYADGQDPRAPAGDAGAAPAVGGEDGGDGNGGAPSSDPDADTAADAAAAAPPNLVPNPSFEADAGSRCGDGWNYWQGTGSRVATAAHTGSFACQICGEGSPSTAYTLDSSSLVDPPVHAGDRWLAEAWVARPPGATTTQQAALYIRVYAASGAVTLETFESAHVALTDAWQHVSVVGDATKDGVFNVYLAMYDGPAAACGLVDDVAVYHLR